LEILRNFTYLTEAIPCILCIIFHKRIIAKDMKVFFVYTSLFFAFLLSILYIRYHLHSRTLDLLFLRFVIIIEFLSLSLFYYYNIKARAKKNIGITCAVAFILYSYYDYHISKNDDFSYIPLVIESLFFLIVIPYFFYECMRHNVAKPIYQSPSFWISIAFLIYFSGNFFQFLFSENYTDPQFIALSNTVYDIVTIIKDTLLSIAVFINNIEEKKTHTHKIPISINLDIFNPIKNKY